MTELVGDVRVFVPVRGSAAARTIEPASGIVGMAPAPSQELVTLYYEGFIFRGDDRPDFFAKLFHAAGRLMARTPSQACGSFPLAELVPVATYDGLRFVVGEVLDAGILTAWSGEQIEAIRGVRLPAGPADWGVAAALADGPHARLLLEAGNRSFHKTQAGQVVVLDDAHQVARVYDHDDPALRAVLRDDAAPAPMLRSVLGRAAALTEAMQ